ncbi:MAG: hypothetical protein Kow0090_13170 [Myxococcota bacterium]
MGGGNVTFPGGYDDEDEEWGKVGDPCYDDKECKPPAVCINYFCDLASDSDDDDNNDDNTTQDDDTGDDTGDDVAPEADAGKEGCKTDFDCRGGFYCDAQSGKCYPGSGEDCMDTSECPDGEECKFFRCRKVEGGDGGGGSIGASDDDDNDSDTGGGDAYEDVGEDDAGDDDVDGGGDEDVCVPDCKGKVCGADGCGGSCGECGKNSFCEGGACKCLYSPSKCGEVCCANGEECINDVCCPNEVFGKCAQEGAVVCEAKTPSVKYRECEKANGCLVWSDYESCPGGGVCRGEGVCGSDECGGGQAKCEGNDVYKCSPDDDMLFFVWKKEQTCATACLNGKCTGCVTDNDCIAPTPFCEPIGKTCVECTKSGDCPPHLKYCDTYTGSCKECSTDSHCQSFARCDTQTNTCKCVYTQCGSACCDSGYVCYPNVCCKPKTCADVGSACGTLSDGCGGTIDCSCSPGNVCYQGACCKPKTCADYPNGCGVLSDGCGGTVNCSCSPGDTCYNGQCCKPKTCADYPTSCGSLSNGCGGTVNCNCGSKQVCVNNACQCEDASWWLYPGTKHCYFLGCWKSGSSCVAEGGPWQEAKDFCASKGMYLVSFRSIEEQNDVINHYGLAGYCVWMGCTDEASEGTFVWVSAEPFTYTNWCPGKPDNDGNEDYCEFSGCYNWSQTQCWNDWINYDSFWGYGNPYFICESYD